MALTNRWDALSCYPRHNCQGPGIEHLGECHIQCLTPPYSHRVRKADSVGLLLFHPEISTPSFILLLTQPTLTQLPRAAASSTQSCSRHHLLNQLIPGPKPVRGMGLPRATGSSPVAGLQIFVSSTISRPPRHFAPPQPDLARPALSQSPPLPTPPATKNSLRNYRLDASLHVNSPIPGRS